MELAPLGTAHRASRESPAGNRPRRELPAGPAGDCPLGQPRVSPGRGGAAEA